MEKEKVVALRVKLTGTRCFFALALAFHCLHPRPLGAETLTLTTYYPAPYGAYAGLLTTGGTALNPVNTLLARDGGGVGIGTNNTGIFKLSVKGPAAFDAIDYASHQDIDINNTLKYTGESVPGPGRLFYNFDKDAFYYSSKEALPGDPSTWFKPVSGFDAATVIDVSLPGPFTVGSGYTTLKTWYSAKTPDLGTITNSGTRARSTVQKSAGLYVVSFTGTFCSPGSAASPSAPKVKLLGTYVGAGWKTLITYTDDIEFDTAAPSHCGDMDSQSMFVATPGGQAWQFEIQVKRYKPNDYVKNFNMTVKRVLGF